MTRRQLVSGGRRWGRSWEHRAFERHREWRTPPRHPATRVLDTGGDSE